MPRSHRRNTIKQSEALRRSGLSSIQPQLAGLKLGKNFPRLRLADAHDQARSGVSLPTDGGQGVELPRVRNIEDVGSLGESGTSRVARVPKPIDAEVLWPIRVGTVWIVAGHRVPLNTHQQVHLPISIPICKRERDRRPTQDGRQIEGLQCEVFLFCKRP